MLRMRKIDPGIAKAGACENENTEEQAVRHLRGCEDPFSQCPDAMVVLSLFDVDVITTENDRYSLPAPTMMFAQDMLRDVRGVLLLRNSMLACGSLSEGVTGRWDDDDTSILLLASHHSAAASFGTCGFSFFRVLRLGVLSPTMHAMFGKISKKMAWKSRL